LPEGTKNYQGKQGTSIKKVYVNFAAKQKNIKRLNQFQVLKSVLKKLSSRFCNRSLVSLN
jgi:hypothetical protein